MLNTQKWTEVIEVERQRIESAETRVDADKRAPGVDGNTIEELPCLLQHKQELTTCIYRGKYTPSTSKTS